MGKLFFTVIIAVAVLLGIITFANQPAKQSVFSNPFASVSPQQGNTSSQSASATPVITPLVTIGPGEPVPTLAATRSAVIRTGKGNIYLTLFQQQTPNTVKNFIQKAQNSFYNGLTFHRVENWVIQGGDPNGNGTGGNDMATEATSTSFVTGSVGMAGHQGPNGQIIANDAQFFIVKSDSTWLNNQYTNFGIVTSGMDVVNKIQIGDKILGIDILN